MSLDTGLPTMEALSPTTNLGSIRITEKARWEEQTYQTVPTKPVLVGTYAVFFFCSGRSQHS